MMHRTSVPAASPTLLAHTCAAPAVALAALVLFPVLGRASVRPTAPGATAAAVVTKPSPSAWEKEVVEVVAEGRGRINYEAGVVKAVGLGAVPPPTLSRTRAQRVLDARESALADAYRNLALSASRVRVTAETRVSNFLLKSDDVRVRVQSVVKGADVIEERLLPNSGLYRVVVQMPLNGEGSLAQALGLEKGRAKTIVAVSASAPRPRPQPTPTPGEANPFTPGAPAPEGAEYTSLIVDCRGLRVAATMSPRLMDSDGREVYGTVKCSPDYAIETGIVAYPRSTMDAARHSKRAGHRPLVVRARGVADRHRFCPVVSERDADFIRDANRSGRFFERTAVIFLVDQDS